MANSSKITLICIKEKNKLRIRFLNFIDTEGKIFTNVYNNEYNCRFPRNLREEGRMFEIPSSDIKLNAKEGKTPYYIVSKKKI